MAVLVLQPLAEQRGATGGGRHQEPTRAHVGRLPDEVADTLEPEHRIEGVEGHHRHATGGVGGAGGDEAGHRAGLGDALLEDLALRRLGVRQQQVVVDRLVLLALRGVDVQLAEQRVHAERAGLVGDDRHDARADVLVAGEAAQQAGERHRRRRPPGRSSRRAARRTGRRRAARAGGGRRWCAWGSSRRAPCGAPSCTGTRSSPSASVKYGGCSASRPSSGITSSRCRRSRMARI